MSDRRERTINLKVIKKWVNALENGNYTQGFKQLKNGREFCALGILIDIYNNKKWNGDCTLNDRMHSLDITWLTTEFGFKYDTQTEIANMNDKQGKSFWQIAQWVKNFYRENHGVEL